MLALAATFFPAFKTMRSMLISYEYLRYQSYLERTIQLL